MARVEIYTKLFCGFCGAAKRLLDAKGIAYEEIDITMGGPRRAEMIQRANGRTTVPQIFIDGAHVGGCDDLHDLDERGRLDPMLAGG
jgi:glutaredoxin 3